MKKRIFLALLAVASAFVMTSCGKDKDDDPQPAKISTESKYTESADGVSVSYPYPDAEDPLCSYTWEYKFDGDNVTEYTTVITCKDAATASAVKDSWNTELSTGELKDAKQDGNVVTLYWPMREDITKDLAIVGIKAIGELYGVEVPADAE